MNGYTLTQLTNNSVDESFPQIDGTNIAWLSEARTSEAEVFLYNGSETIQLSDNEVEDSAPKISGNNVVWAGNVENASEIFLYNGSETIQLTDNEVEDSAPKISGNNVIWKSELAVTGRQASPLLLYNGSETIQLSEDVSEADISGNSVVWSELVNLDIRGEVFLYDGSETIQLTDNSTNDFNPSIAGDNVAWLGYDGNDNEVFFYDGNTTTQLTDNDTGEFPLQVSESLVAWQNETGVFVYDGDDTVKIAGEEDENAVLMEVSEDNVLLGRSSETVEPELVVYNHNSGDFDVVLDENISLFFKIPDLSGNNVAFIDHSADSDSDEIFLATSSESDDTSNSSTESASTIYRFLNTDTGVHFYTASEAERDNIRENLPNFTLEGASYTEVDTLTGMPEPQPVYRFLNTDTGTHLYTISETEKDAVEDTANFSFEGEAFFAYSQEQEGTIPIYRFLNTATGTHFYTPSVEEKNAVESSLPEFLSEDVAYYALPAEV